MSERSDAGHVLCILVAGFQNHKIIDAPEFSFLVHQVCGALIFFSWLPDSLFSGCFCGRLEILHPFFKMVFYFQIGDTLF